MSNKFVSPLLLSLFLITQLVHAQWVNRYNGQGDFSDRFNAIATDNNGNIFLAGSTVDVGNDQDILVVKLNPNGDTVWTNRYDGPAAGGVDVAQAIALDNLGNVYVTGFAKFISTATDLVTIKYDSLGVIQWVANYGFVSDQYDQGNSIAVDGSGNVFVTGQSDGDPSVITNEDYVTIKYDASGSLQWVQRSDGSGSGTDRPSKVAIDPSGNPVVTGRSDNVADYDYLTIMYNTANGAPLWSAIYDRTHNDWATDLVINPSNGNIYVTGRSRLTDYDYATICYNSGGTQIWATIYNNGVGDDRATHIKLDPAGNLYVTGQSDVDPNPTYNYDIATIKYNSSGTQQWVKTFGGAALNDEVPAGLYVNASGDADIVGYTDADPSANVSNNFIAIKYNTSGTALWSQIFSGTGTANDVPAGITEDSFGNVIVTGFSEIIPQKDGITIKYNSTGALQWTKYYNGTGDNSDMANAMAADAGGNLLVAGYVTEYGLNKNFAVQKIDINGNTAWMKTINGTSSGSADNATAITIDASGFIYVAGYTHNKGYSNDFAIAKLTQLGDTVWVRYYDYITESDKAFAIGLDASNNVYVTGKSDKDPSKLITNDDILTVKYSTNGVFQWAARYNGTGNGSDGGVAMKVTSSGNVYVAGKAFNGSNTDFALLKYNSLGVQQWVNLYNGGGNDEGRALHIDALENSYITGYGDNASITNTDIITIKYNAAGAQQWVKTHAGTGGGSDAGSAISLDNSGNVVVAGTVDADTSVVTINNNMCLLKYDNNGNNLWDTIFNGSNNADDIATSLAIDNSNNIFLAGTCNGPSNYDYTTIKYQPSGIIDTVLLYNGTGNNSDKISSILIKNNLIYITGGSYGPSKDISDYTTIVYNSTLLGIKSIDASVDLVDVYPNPFMEFAIVDFSSQETLSEHPITITMYDVSGKCVEEKIIYNPGKIILNRNNLSSGTYLLNISQNSKIIYNNKLIIN